ncbi:hypothetical protein AVEN_252801-1 [Araneus ventricosus]|uniref:Uncharacterized protein n=1 Tax=Araneus ventricosus TaxID=182803 RepID=A0A4Y2CL10_ARAVE|nr:hypothetical protein AVEN_252801-1 [Araneus ventricosus]
MVSDSDCIRAGSSKVIATRRISLKRDGQIIPTRHVILTFDTILQKNYCLVISGCDIRPYIPNPARASNVSDLGNLKLHAVDHFHIPHCSERRCMKKQFESPEKCF